MLTVTFNNQLEFSTSRIMKSSKLLSSYVKTVYNHTKTKVPSFYEQIWQFTLENNHDVQIIADFIVII